MHPSPAVVERGKVSIQSHLLRSGRAPARPCRGLLFRGFMAAQVRGHYDPTEQIRGKLKIESVGVLQIAICKMKSTTAEASGDAAPTAFRTCHPDRREESASPVSRSNPFSNGNLRIPQFNIHHSTASRAAVCAGNGRRTNSAVFYACTMQKPKFYTQYSV